jgi:hypothetical protein
MAEQRMPIAGMQCWIAGKRSLLISSMCIALIFSGGCNRYNVDVDVSPASLESLATPVQLELGGRTVGTFSGAADGVTVKLGAGDPRDAHGLPVFTLEFGTACGPRRIPAMITNHSMGSYSLMVQYHNLNVLDVVEIYYDNRGGPAAPMTIGEIQSDIPANSKGSVTVPTIGCSGSGAVTFDGKPFGSVKYEESYTHSWNSDGQNYSEYVDRSKVLYFLGTQPGRCYDNETLDYSPNGLSPSYSNGLSSGHLEELSENRIDYFLEKAPETVQSQYGFIAYAIEDCDSTQN